MFDSIPLINKANSTTVTWLFLCIDHFLLHASFRQPIQLNYCHVQEKEKKGSQKSHREILTDVWTWHFSSGRSFKFSHLWVLNWREMSHLQRASSPRSYPATSHTRVWSLISHVEAEKERTCRWTKMQEQNGFHTWLQGSNQLSGARPSGVWSPHPAPHRLI